MSEYSLRIETGSNVAVIGGGPAGCFFALYLMHYTGEMGIHPDITVYQQRDFDNPGPKGCKGCAGILSASLIRNMSQLGMELPAEIVQDRIARYALHSPYTTITISQPEEGVEVASVFRGGGPSVSRYDNPASFDGWLLRHVQSHGINVEYQSVTGVYLGREARVEVAGKKLQYDLIVLASGINTKPLPIRGLDYIPPKTQLMAQAELYAGADEVESHLGNVAHVFLLPHSGIVFGTLVPKGPSIHVSVLSSRKHPVSVTDFLTHDIVRNALPDHYERTCACKPRAVVGYAINYYTDRFVAVGDATVTRLYKDGIGSSLLTAREAARTVACHGLSRQDFKHHYRPFCKAIDRDNQWGHLLFSLHSRTKDSRAFLLAQHRQISDEQHNTRRPQPFTKIVWGMFTGGYSYGRMSRMVFEPITLIKFSRSFTREILTRPFHRGADNLKTLHVGNKKVLILGSGFVGTYALRHLVRYLNRNEHVETTMVSDENFFLFSPLLHEVAMGRIETRHIAYPIRRLQRRDRFNFVQASVERIDLGAREVVTSAGILDFDYLVLALGSVTDMSGLYSRERNVFTLKTLHDSVLIRNHIVGIFEQASRETDPEQQKRLLTFIVSGGGYTGVQLVAELREFVFRHLTKYYKTIDPDNIRILLIEAEQKITAGLHNKLGAYTMKQLRSMGIDVRMRSRVTRVWEDQVEINSTEILPTSTLIWVAGVVANPRIAELDIEKDSIGRALVNDYLEIPGFPGVYAAGDCAHFKDPKSGQPIPPRAHTAVRQAKIVARNVLAEIRGREKQPYRYTNSGEVVSLGQSKAVFRFYGLRLYGLPARLVWLVGYSLLVTGMYNRARIIMDWSLSWLFGRDTTYVKLDNQ